MAVQKRPSQIRLRRELGTHWHRSCYCSRQDWLSVQLSLGSAQATKEILMLRMQWTLLVAALAANGCLSNSYVVKSDELLRLANTDPQVESARSVRSC